MTTLSPGLSSLTLDLRDLKVCPRPTRQPSLLASGKDMSLGGCVCHRAPCFREHLCFFPTDLGGWQGAVAGETQRENLRDGRGEDGSGEGAGGPL